MNRVAVVTAVFGAYDPIRPHPDIPGTDFICYTDQPTSAPGWDVRIVEMPGHPRLAAKYFKIYAGRLNPDAEYTIWIDASHQITDPGFVDWAVGSVGESGVAAYQHPWRDCIYTEAEGSLTENPAKYGGLPLLEQVASYRNEGHPAHWGLWATGTLARRNTPEVDGLMAAWAHENYRWTYQDQLSLPVVCRRAEITPSAFPCHQVAGNPWTIIHGHASAD